MNIKPTKIWVSQNSDVDTWAELLGDEIVEKCLACGAEYTLDTWRRLKCLGVSTMPDDGQMPRALEMRDCTCGSTISIGLDGDGKYYQDNLRNGEKND